ncbi:protein of unknown function [Rhodovastum atsumiense]|nr:protein of unknown function [Rhodovastum atsumiense]
MAYFMREMQTFASPHADDWALVRSRLPRDLDLSRLARETKALLRPRGVRDAGCGELAAVGAGARSGGAVDPGDGGLG